MRKSLSFFIPVYNEEGLLIQNTEKLIAFVDTLDVPYEIILCSNGSTDRTIELGYALEQAYPTKVRFFFVKEKGVGKALKHCIIHFKYPYILSLDMDLSADLSFIKEGLGFLNKYDIVLGSKRIGVQYRKIIRKLGSGLYVFIVRLLLGIGYSDYSLGAKIYKKVILERYTGLISDYGTDYVINIVYHAFKDGYRIIEIPVICFDNRGSRFHLVREGMYRYKKVFELWLKNKKLLLVKSTYPFF